MDNHELMQVSKAATQGWLGMQITFEGDRTVRGFYQFLKKNAAIPFALPKSEKSKGSKADPEIVQSSEADLKDELWLGVVSSLGFEWPLGPSLLQENL